jgi:hypothetical protein
MFAVDCKDAVLDTPEFGGALLKILWERVEGAFVLGPATSVCERRHEFAGDAV